MASHFTWSQFTETLPAGFTLTRVGRRDHWRVTLPDGRKVDMPSHAKHTDCVRWCYEQARHTRIRELVEKSGSLTDAEAEELQALQEQVAEGRTVELRKGVAGHR